MVLLSWTVSIARATVFEAYRQVGVAASL